jgi:Bacterial regulatory proteins, luxR family
MHRLATGRTMKQVGGDLGLSKRTVEAHARSVYQKLGVRGQLEFGMWYERNFPTSGDSSPIVLGMLYLMPWNHSPDLPRILEVLRVNGLVLAPLDAPVTLPDALPRRRKAE